MKVSSKRIQRLINDNTTGSRISIYIPTHPKSSSQTLSQDTIRFKNALQDIQNSPDYDSSKLGKTIKSLEKLHDDTGFWKNQDLGLAVFGDKDGYEYFHLPYETTEATYLKDRFVISPLAIMHSIGTTFYVLDVNLTQPRLMISHDGSLVEAGAEDMPGSFQDMIAGDEYKPELQHQPAPRGSGDSNRFHGHSVNEEIEEDTTEYLIQVAKVINDFLKDNDLPLLLVGEKSRVGNIRPHINYDNLLETSIDGNFEKHSLQELHNIALEAINKYDSQRRQKIIDELLSADSKNIVAGDDQVAEAAKAGRVERLYVPAYKRTNDSVRSNIAESIILQLPEDIKDIETLVVDVLSQGGTVQAVEIGSQHKIQQIKALSRY